ncbi:hypothetical protein FNP_2405 [Fusobacterium polymorphum ATCC 10953]|uniref:Uncharacterized protein n=1 Tax=Fusobacterium polymorphum ATCC 10953 TaxID=393480 RepID=A5TSB6_FUSNP|nr:hypothetical protein FNP_2405 [Fusobacterium polymorphum ATCC 10953]
MCKLKAFSIFSPPIRLSKMKGKLEKQYHYIIDFLKRKYYNRLGTRSICVN